MEAVLKITAVVLVAIFYILQNYNDKLEKKNLEIKIELEKKKNNTRDKEWKGMEEPTTGRPHDQWSFF